MTAIKEDAFGPDKGTEVEPADKAGVACDDLVTVAMDQLGLDNGRGSLGTIQFRSEGEIQIDIAVVTEGDVLGLRAVAPDLKQGEVAAGTDGLAAVTGHHDIDGIGGQALEGQPWAVDDQTIGCTALLSYTNGRIVRVVNPVDIGCDIEHHGDRLQYRRSGERKPH